MSSDHLSFNQSGDDREDDGSRWRAYLALLRRTGANPPAPELDDEFAGAGEPLPPADLAASSVGPDAESGATAGLRSTPPGAVSFRLGSGLVGATIGLAAGILLTGASLIPHPPVHRDAAVPTRSSPIEPGQEGRTRLAAASGPPCLSGGDASSAGSMLAAPIVFATPGFAPDTQLAPWLLNTAPAPSAETLPTRLAAARSPQHPPKPMRHLASWTHECRHCRGDVRARHHARRSETVALAARWQTPYSR